MLNYEIYDNNSDNWVVFIHGMGGSTLTWKRQISDFSNKYNLLLIDLPGHGKSQTFNFNKRLDAKLVSYKIKEVLDYLSIKSADFVSLSIGTLVTAQFVVTYPQYVTSVVFGGAILKINAFYKCLVALTNTVKRLLPHRLVYKSFALMLLPKKNHELTRKIFVRESLKMRKQAFLAWVDYLSVIINPQHLLDGLKKLNTKMLFISGEEDYCFVNGTQKLVEILKQPQLEIIKKCGHVCSIEKHHEFNEKALKFLESVHKTDKIHA